MSKPICKLTDRNGNIFNLLSIACQTLKINDMQEQSKEMHDRVLYAKSYGEALSIIEEYVEII